MLNYEQWTMDNEQWTMNLKYGKARLFKDYWFFGCRRRGAFGGGAERMEPVQASRQAIL